METMTLQHVGLGRTLRLAGLPCLWLAIVVLMIQSHLDDPYNPALTGTAAYGHNHEGALLQGMIWTFTEVVIVSAILRPWTYRRNWGRALAALALLVPWTGLSLLLTMHAGGIVALHTLWLMLITALVFVVLLSTLFVRRV